MYAPLKKNYQLQLAKLICFWGIFLEIGNFLIMLSAFKKHIVISTLRNVYLSAN